jgi:hypothetical protein
MEYHKSRQSEQVLSEVGDHANEVTEGRGYSIAERALSLITPKNHIGRRVKLYEENPIRLRWKHVPQSYGQSNS